jgi:spermidine synthase
MDEPVTVAKSAGPRGEVVLRRRGCGRQSVDELIVNGAFAMDSSETTSERCLARLALERCRVGGRILIAGLGLGYTVDEALELPVAEIDVVEIEASLVQWAMLSVTPTLGRLAANPRVNLIVGDVADVLAGSAASAELWDAIALDVDNGPDFLIHATNASLYTGDLLSLTYARLAPGGRLAIWCQGPSPALMDTLSDMAPAAGQHLFEVVRGERRFSYAICTLDRPPTQPEPAK